MSAERAHPDCERRNNFCQRCGYRACMAAAQAKSGPGYKIGHDNREAVRAYFLSHVGVTNAEVAKALGLSVMAVGRHVKTLRGEWQVQPWSAPAGDRSQEGS